MLKISDAAKLEKAEQNRISFSDSSTIENLSDLFEMNFSKPIVNETGLTKETKLHFTYPTNFSQENLKKLISQLGLELVPTNMPVEMLVVEKSN